VVGQQNADIGDTVQLRDVFAMATIFWHSIYGSMGCTLAAAGKYD